MAYRPPTRRMIDVQHAALIIIRERATAGQAPARVCDSSARVREAFGLEFARPLGSSSRGFWARVREASGLEFARPPGS
eukprot:58545-Pleurochrysis_carterae.AAC.1